MRQRFTVKDLNILYEDEDILVCVKPAGLATQTRQTGQQDLVSLLRNYRAGKKEPIYIGLIHRLDQPVEGILLVGKNQKSTAKLSRQLTGEAFGKIYLALVHGRLPEEKGRLEDYLVKDGKSNRSRVTEKTQPGAKRAALDYELIKYDETKDRSLVKIYLHTGRHHQIRVQLARQGTPIVGDYKYGGGNQSLEDISGTGSGVGDQKTRDREGLALCAAELHFKHPVSGKDCSFEIEPSWGLCYTSYTYYLP